MEEKATKVQQQFLTFCHLCLGRCSRKATVEDGKIVGWGLELESGLPTEFCPYTRGLAVMEISSHPERLKYPQKRVGARGEGKWERITWDEALDTIAERLSDLKGKYGPECVALGLGEPKGMEFAFAQRFASAFGTPNVVTPGSICGGPQAAASLATYGNFCVSDNECSPRLIVLWGSNPIHTNNGIRREYFRAALLDGAKLVVIDPRKIDIAKRADLWLNPRPASDGALAMGLLKVIIEEKLYDEDFVAKWTVGFDELREHVKTFTLDDVERVTWVPRQQIEKFARLYAQVKPALMQWGNALEQSINAFQTCRAISILRAITGNLCIPGGEVFITPATYYRPGRFLLLKDFPRKKENTPGSEFKWAMSSAFIPYQSLIKAILEEKPYPVKAVLFVLTNPLLSYPNSAETYQALMKLDFMVVFELFMTPTAAIADIVLPIAHGAEHDTVGYWPPDAGEIRAYPKLVDPPGEAWSDEKIIIELAKRLGLGEYFWDDEVEAIDLMLQPSSLTWEDFKEKRILQRTNQPYRKYEDGGFQTPSGKVEIYSKPMEQLGFSPLPLWQEVSRFRFDTSAEYPLLLTNGKDEPYIGSEYRHIAYLRNIEPQPIVELNPETARKAGLKEGDWIYIESRKGKIKQKLVLNRNIDPRVVFASFGWWFPEQSENLHGWSDSNINILTESAPPYDPYIGSVELRGIPCRVSKT